jgi:hypothetical protein
MVVLVLVVVVVLVEPALPVHRLLRRRALLLRRLLVLLLDVLVRPAIAVGVHRVPWQVTRHGNISERTRRSATPADQLF